MEQLQNLETTHREQSDKFTYYVIALCVTAIGFAVYNTLGQSMKQSQIPLGASVLCWSLSVYLGLKVLRYRIQILLINHRLIKVQIGTDELAGTHPEKKQIGYQVLMENINILSRRINIAITWQLWMFYLGMLSFVGWHVYEMYLKIV
jgi:hypothetical protein